VTAVAVWGSARVAAADWTRAGQPVRVGLIQGNVDQGQKWNPASASAIFGDYLRMTRQAIAEGARFVVWPFPHLKRLPTPSTFGQQGLSVGVGGASGTRRGSGSLAGGAPPRPTAVADTVRLAHRTEQGDTW